MAELRLRFSLRIKCNLNGLNREYGCGGDEILYQRSIGGISPLQERYRLNVCNTAIRWKLAELCGNRISGYYIHTVPREF